MFYAQPHSLDKLSSGICNKSISASLSWEQMDKIKISSSRNFKEYELRLGHICNNEEQSVQQDFWE